MKNFEPNQELQQNYYGRDLVTKSNWYGRVARAYNKVRPRYSDELINFAVECAELPTKAKILEIGCGPGIATTSFAIRGFQLVSIEPNREASQLARENCAVYPDVEICQTTLEKWLVIPKEFDGVLAATSLHWVDPEIGYPKIAQALKDNGSLILLWNAGLHPSEDINRLLQPIYRTYAPSLKPFKARKKERDELQALGQNVINSGYFSDLVSQELIIEVNYSIEDYLLLLSTYSPYIALETVQRQNLFTAMEECLKKACGNQISLSYLSLAQVFSKL